MDKRTELSDALKVAVKAQEKIDMATIRLILAALKDRDIAERTKGHAEGIGDNEVLTMLQSMVKQRRESSETYRKAGRDDLADREDTEIKVIRRFLPEQMSDDEIRNKVDDLLSELNVTDIREMGKVMSELKTRFSGQLDMSKASGVVKERLAS